MLSLTYTTSKNIFNKKTPFIVHLNQNLHAFHTNRPIISANAHISSSRKYITINNRQDKSNKKKRILHAATVSILPFGVLTMFDGLKGISR